MRIDVITLFPQMFDALTCGGITSRAIDKGLLQLGLWNPRDYTHDRHRTVDDRPYGGGPGMVMSVAPLQAALTAAKQTLRQDGITDVQVMCLTPQGRRLDQSAVKELAQRSGFVLVSGRYEGIDERFLQTEVDEEWSIGDFVLSGGELAAMVTIDAVARMLPGVLGHDQSAEQDSFMNGLLDYPHYTRPEAINGLAVPEVLMSGDHAAIARWRLKQALGKTWLKRRDLFENIELDAQQQQLLAEFIAEQEGQQ
ncbi:MAG: tRNA (guanosine(37)-N1)-methyltransferase TrmD [Gammaproteobacteria bacterium]